MDEANVGLTTHRGVVDDNQGLKLSFGKQTDGPGGRTSHKEGPGRRSIRTQGHEHLLQKERKIGTDAPGADEVNSLKSRIYGAVCMDCKPYDSLRHPFGPARVAVVQLDVEIEQKDSRKRRGSRRNRTAIARRLFVRERHKEQVAERDVTMW